MTTAMRYCQIMIVMLSNEERRRPQRNILYGWMFKHIVSDCLRRGISHREVVRRLGIGLRTFLKWSHAETWDPIPLSIDTLARL